MISFTRLSLTNKLWLAAVVIAVGSFIVSKLLNNENDYREIYERQLSERMSKIPDYVARDIKNLPKPAQPDKAAIQDFFMTFDPKSGIVPKERLMRVYQELEKNPKARLTNPLQWNGTSANMGGRTRAIMWDPNDPAGRKVWAGGVTGGLWYRTDITNDMVEWEPVNDFWSSLNISCITYDPNNPTTFYVGTGEAETALIIYRESSGIGDGIWRSTDGGQTWSLMESTLDFEYVTDIVVRNEEGQSVIYAGVVSGVYKGSVHYSYPSDGLFRSEDNGLTWEQVLPDIPGYGAPYAVSDIELGTDGRIYVGTMQNVDIEGGAVILYSDDGFSGTWTVIDQYAEYIKNHAQYNIPARVMVAAAPSDANVVYAQIAAGYNNYFNYYRGRYILKSTNKGETWSTLPLPASDWSTLAWHAFVLKVDPNNANRIFTGGLDMWKSVNSGTSWTKISDWSLMYSGGGDQYLHADQHDIQFKPGSSTTFITCNDGGVFYTETATAGYPAFLEKNQGYNTLQLYTGAITPQTGSTNYVGGLQDNGTLLYTGQPLTINNMISGGDGAACFFDDADPLMLTSIYYNRYYVFMNFNYLTSLDYESGVFINPADFDVKTNTLFANAVSFSGENPNSLLRISGIPYNTNGDFIGLTTNTNVYYSHIKASPHAPAGTSNLYIGTQAGRVYKSTNAHANPQTVEITGNEFPTAYVSCIAVGSTEDILLVTFSNYGVEALWQTIDGGQTWQNVSGDMPDIPVRWAIYHPENDNQVMLATELGIWTTNWVNAPNVSWVQDAQGMANVRVDMLTLRDSDNTVLAATHGRGFYTAEFLLDPGVAVQEQSNPTLSIYPNPSNGLIHVDLTFIEQKEINLRISDISGKLIFEKKSMAGEIEVIDLAWLQKGTYLVSVHEGQHSFTEKIVLK
ncbi:MAG: T9SS type A sorting domain-containing protein [Bacteroidales bacterium]|nr:T9SS type A sorting domain-containing protein [Bacteroidales bacterium]